MNNIIIALDAMGGDYGPESVISGASFALSELLPINCNVHFNIYGQADKVLPLLSKYKRVKENSTLINTTEVVLANDKASVALRHRKASSMRCAIDDVKHGNAAGVVSSGNTGALMAISKFVLGTLPNIHRPAIVTALPSKLEDFVLLDLGANAECNADSLFQFAIMGNAFAKTVLNIENPKVALLNIGSEEIKGTDTIREAFSLLKNVKNNLDFCGYIEANQIFDGKINVIVADGFSGNVMLKTAESISETIISIVKDTFSHSLITKFASLLLKPKLKKHLSNFNPKARNGAMLVGLNGIVVKSHGNADKISFAYAIKVAANAIMNNINAKIINELSNTEHNENEKV